MQRWWDLNLTHGALGKYQIKFKAASFKITACCFQLREVRKFVTLLLKAFYLCLQKMMNAAGFFKISTRPHILYPTLTEGKQNERSSRLWQHSNLKNWMLNNLTNNLKLLLAVEKGALFLNCNTMLISLDSFCVWNWQRVKSPYSCCLDQS